jgi:hypothetical protein
MPVTLDIERRRQARHDRRMARAREVVPKGMYCYTPKSFGYREDGTPSMQIDPCPYWKRRGDWPEQSYGYCRLMKVGDMTPGRQSNGRRRGTMLLWDQVKECDVNVEFPGDEDILEIES